MDLRAEIARLGKDLASDENLKAEFLGFGTNAEAAVAFANSKGYSFGIEDVKSLLPGNELSDSQLERVAGGSLDKIFASAGLAGVDLSEAAFVIMQQAIEGMDSDLRAGMADIKGSAGSSSFPRRHR